MAIFMQLSLKAFCKVGKQFVIITAGSVEKIYFQNTDIKIIACQIEKKNKLRKKIKRQISKPGEHQTSPGLGKRKTSKQNTPKC